MKHVNAAFRAILFRRTASTLCVIARKDGIAAKGSTRKKIELSASTENRTSGAVLLATPFLRRVDWASSIGADGRPVVKDPRGCPVDAANWAATAFSPETGLYYLMALEECVGKPTGYPDQTGQRFLRALNIETGAIAWEVPQPGAPRAKTWSGVLATATGLLFYGQPNGGFAAVDQRDGRLLWQFPTNARMKAGPMTFTTGGRQYVAVAAGPNILCFGL